MTDPRMTTTDAPVTVDVTQDDRVAAAPYMGFAFRRVLDGQCDDSGLVQQFARHRLAALASAPAGDGIDMAKIRYLIDGWFLGERDIRRRYTIYHHGQIIEQIGVEDRDVAHERLDELRWASVSAALSSATNGGVVRGECDRRTVEASDDFDRGWNAALASVRDQFPVAPAGDAVEALAQAAERAGCKEVPAAIRAGEPVLINTTIALDALARPRAAVGEQQVLDELIRQFSRDGIPLTQEIYAPVSRAILALQSPPAKVEG